MDSNSIAQVVADPEFGQRVFNQFMDIFITPEVMRRQESGELEKPLDLRAALIVFFPDGRHPEIRINGEVKLYATARSKSAQAKKLGDIVYEHELAHFEYVRLTENDDPDCGFVAILRLSEEWNLYFDFRYNKNFARKHLEVANQFYAAAAFSLDQQNWSPFIDNLFSAAELAAKAQLVTTFLELRDSKKHTAVSTRYNQMAHLGNVEPMYRDTFNKLSQLRYPARYLSSELGITKIEAVEWLHIVRGMIDTAERQIQ